MSDRGLRAALLACVVIAAPAQAQEPEQLRRHEARLLERQQELLAEAAAAGGARFNAERRTVLTEGPLHLAYPDWAPVAGDEPLLRSLQAEVRRYGTAADTLRPDTVLVGVIAHEHGSPWRVGYRIGELSGAREMRLDSAGSAAWVGEIASAALQDWGLSLLDPRLRKWIGALDQRNSVDELRDPIVRDLVGSPSARARRCLRGAPEECRLLLELGDGPIPRLDAYEPTDLPGLFERMWLSERIPGRANCVGKRDGRACAELVRLGRIEPPHSVSLRTRQSLFIYAITAGGGDAWLRLHRAQGRPLAEQLGAAAGMPVDSLLASWQHDLLRGRRTTVAGSVPSLLLALAWSVIGVLLFAWRYRWRHV